MAEVGGMKTRWLFPDQLEEGKEYLIEVAGQGEHTSRTKGTKVPYIVLLGKLGHSEAVEHQLCVWRIQSKEKFHTDRPGKYLISRLGNDVFFKPTEG